MSLAFGIRYGVGAFRLEVAGEIAGGLTALVGPSGAGKTTVLNILAGLIRPQHATISLDGKVLADTATGTWVPPHRRPIGYVFQEARLLPHLTVRQNLHYPRWAGRYRAADSLETELIALLTLEPLLSRYPQTLSGGEKQRVALARALLAGPQLLLLDEPLASVDEPHRTTILPYLDRIRADHRIPTIYVTHTWSNVAGRADQVVELGDGQIAFAGSSHEAVARRSTRRSG